MRGRAGRRRVAAYNGPWGSPKHGRGLPAARPVTADTASFMPPRDGCWAATRGCPVQAPAGPRGPAWDAAWTEPAFKARRDPNASVI